MGMKEALDYEELLKKQEWLCQRNLPMVVSPDFDGLLCALLMSSQLGWRLMGFYDGKTLALSQPAKHISEFVFLDMEIFRPTVRSIGNHMLQWSSRDSLPNFQKAINPNLLRGTTFCEFKRKYPFGTSHFLLALLANICLNFQLPASRAVKAVLLYPDGTHQVLLNYRGNVIDWLRWMKVKEVRQPIRGIFQALATMTLSEVVHGLDWLSQQLREFGFTHKDDPCKFDPTNKADNAKAQNLWQFLQEVTDLIAPQLPQVNWFVKFDAKTDTPKAQVYRSVIAQKPLSFALTSKAREQGFQYTLVPSEWKWLTD